VWCLSWLYFLRRVVFVVCFVLLVWCVSVFLVCIFCYVYACFFVGMWCCGCLFVCCCRFVFLCFVGFSVCFCIVLFKICKVINFWEYRLWLDVFFFKKYFIGSGNCLLLEVWFNFSNFFYNVFLIMFPIVFCVLIFNENDC